MRASSSALQGRSTRQQRVSSSSARPQRGAAAAAVVASARCAAATQQQQQHHRRRQHQQQLHNPFQQQQHLPSWVARDAAAPALATQSVDEDAGPAAIGADAVAIFEYALQLAWTAETYEVHTWMLLLGILRSEDCVAARALKAAGLEDLYAAWHEVLWALNVSDGLEPRAFTPRLRWAPGARAVADGAVRFAGWAGREKVASQDVLMAVAAAGCLDDLFPDLNLRFEAVRRAVQKEAGERYRLPDDDAAAEALAGDDNFL